MESECNRTAGRWQKRQGRQIGQIQNEDVCVVTRYGKQRLIGVERERSLPSPNLRRRDFDDAGRLPGREWHLQDADRTPLTMNNGNRPIGTACLISAR